MSCMYNTPTCVVIPRFPYTSLFRSLNPTGQVLDFPFLVQRHASPGNVNRAVASGGANAVLEMFATPIRPVKACVDRKSTRLNSSHIVISYAVFYVKK